jgi:dimeric dUTPase (all-alpha-NTP-PPase superfamily)
VNPWYNVFVEKAIVDRDMVFRFWRSYRTLELQVIYERYRNGVHCLGRQNVNIWLHF